MNIRLANMADLPAIDQLYFELFQAMAALQPERMQAAKQDMDFVQMAINDEAFAVWVAEDDQATVVGFALVQWQSTPAFACIKARHYAYIMDLMVAKPYRSDGIGHALLSAVKEAAQKQGCSQLELSVLSNNVDAIRFYEREGMAATHQNMAIDL
jgi:ribosomal protein S18 acetylase RimI-like enzyme